MLLAAIKMKIIISILLFVFLISCEGTERNHLPDKEFIVVYESDSRTNLKSFNPSPEEIETFEKGLMSHLTKKTKNGKGITDPVFEKTEPLENRLKYYKRRYFGRINKSGVKIMFVEFVFIRCGGSEEWKNLEYTNSDNQECWWSTEFNLETKKVKRLRYPKREKS
jgi:hypothetical protein